MTNELKKASNDTKDTKELKKATTERKKATKVRKKPKKNLSTEDHLKIVHRYMTSDLTSLQIANEFNTTPDNVDIIVQRHWKSLTNVRETKILSGSQVHNGIFNHKDPAYHALKSIGNVSKINEEFLSLLSEPEDHLLTDHELQYCYHFVATGNNHTSLETAGLAKGLMTAGADKQKRNQYKLAVQLRGHFLRQKKNIAQYITKLKEDQYIPEIIDKQFIQRELLETLHHQKEGGVSPRDRLRTVELLGKTVGAFSDVIKVEEVDPAKALDYIDSLAKADGALSTEVLEINEDT